ncbi:Flagellar hook-basal body complex protein FliE [uncultured Desulfatiglans sp.]|nr:Flagellar hook-basal body complex protein FliE [uncultured Desulfatiglans sp.]
MKIIPLLHTERLSVLQNPGSTEKVQQPGTGFACAFKSALAHVNQLQKTADTAAVDLAAGRREDIHQTMIAIEKADVTFRLIMQIRNKVVAAYEEVMRMQV